MKHESVMFKKLVKMRDFCKCDPVYLWVLAQIWAECFVF